MGYFNSETGGFLVDLLLDDVSISRLVTVVLSFSDDSWYRLRSVIGSIKRATISSFSAFPSTLRTSLSSEYEFNSFMSFNLFNWRLLNLAIIPLKSITLH